MSRNKTLKKIQEIKSSDSIKKTKSVFITFDWMVARKTIPILNSIKMALFDEVYKRGVKDERVLDLYVRLSNFERQLLNSSRFPCDREVMSILVSSLTDNLISLNRLLQQLSVKKSFNPITIIRKYMFKSSIDSMNIVKTHLSIALST